jgi:beta-xylosidase
VVLVRNQGILPLRQALAGQPAGPDGAGQSASSTVPQRVAVVGPLADELAGMLGCYAFPSHHGDGRGGMPEPGVDIPTVLAALRAELPEAQVSHSTGCGVDDPSTDGIAAAAALAADADVCVAVLGDRAGLFGRGTSGEGCDVADLYLPGKQEQLLTALLDTGTPVVLVLLSGRPYALGEHVDRLAAIVQAFFPGEEGGPAVAGVLTGRVTPSGRLPVSVPRHPCQQPTTYLVPLLGHRTDVSSVDPTPLFPFGHGLSYTTFAWEDVQVDRTELPTDGEVTISLQVRNTGERAGAEVVQLYLHDPVAQVTRPVVRLVGYARVSLRPGEARQVSLRMSADLASFTGRRGQRVVEPGALELRLGGSCTDVRHTVRVDLTGPERIVDHHRALTTEVTISEPPS